MYELLPALQVVNSDMTFFRANILQLDVYYSELTLELITETEAYDLAALFGEILIFLIMISLSLCVSWSFLIFLLDFFSCTMLLITIVLLAPRLSFVCSLLLYRFQDLLLCVK